MIVSPPKHFTGSRTFLVRVGRALATYLVLPLISAGFVLVFFEIGLRLAGYQAIYEIYSTPWIFWEYDERLGWRHEPGARGNYVGPRPWPIEFQAAVQINSLGLRGPEVSERQPDELRVLLLGDSMVASFEVEYEQTFGALMEADLARRLNRPVRVLNAGVRGYGSDQSLIYFRERGRLLEPDLVIHFHSGNDPADNATLHEMRRPFGKGALVLREDGSLQEVSTPVPHYETCSEYLLSKTYQVERTDTALNRALCHAQLALFDRSALFSLVTIAIPWDHKVLRRLYYVGNPHADQLALANSDGGAEHLTRLTMAILLELAAEARRQHAEFMMVGDPRHLKVLDLPLLSEHDIEVVDLEALGPRRELRWEHDAHFNPEAHRRLARLLADRVEPRLRRTVRTETR